MRNPDTTKLRRRLVRAWNKRAPSGTTMADLAVEFGMTRGAIGRLLWEARQLGWNVVSLGDAAKGRAVVSYRKRIGEEAFRAGMLRMASFRRCNTDREAAS